MPNPGPTVLKQAILAVVAVSMLHDGSLAKRKNEPNKKKIPYKAMNPSTARIVSSETTLELYLTSIMLLGEDMVWRIFLTHALVDIMVRMIFRPPLVEPAHPPMNMNTTSIILSPFGQISKSAVLYPVAVRIDTIWKAPALRGLSVNPVFLKSKKNTGTEKRIMPR